MRKRSFFIPAFKLTLLLGVFSAFMIFFYTCNLRVNLIAVQYERPMETFDDLVKQGNIVYLPTDIKSIS